VSHLYFIERIAPHELSGLRPNAPQLPCPAVKIGRSIAVQARLQNLASTYGKLRIIAVVCNAGLLEKETHLALQKSRIKLEWFHRDQTVMSFIDSLFTEEIPAEHEHLIRELRRLGPRRILDDTNPAKSADVSGYKTVAAHHWASDEMNKLRDLIIDKGGVSALPESMREFARSVMSGTDAFTRGAIVGLACMIARDVIEKDAP